MNGWRGREVVVGFMIVLLVIGGCSRRSKKGNAQDTTPPVTMANPPGGTYEISVSVTLSSNEPTSIYYTTDGSTPTSASALYASPILIEMDTTLKYLGIDMAGNEEVVRTEEYVITGSTPLSVTTESLPDSVLNEAYSTTLAAQGGVLPYTWSYLGDLPQGLEMDSNGVISGTTTVEETCTFTAVVTDSHLDTAEKELSITVVKQLPSGWTPTTTTGAPSNRWHHSAVWTGKEMILWGGSKTINDQLANGKIYNPKTDTWRPMSTTGAPSRREAHTAVWTGTKMIIWGGGYCGEDLYWRAYDDGFKYDPAEDTWEAISSRGVPSARYCHTAVWTGEEMIVWGGWAGGELGTGARYNPESDTWIPVTTTGAPTPRDGHNAYWTGTEMIIWGHENGAIYNPATDTWRPMADRDTDNTFMSFTSAWTGTELIVWGTHQTDLWTFITLGARYNLESDTWTDIAVNTFLKWRTGAQAVWTGTEMIVWGMLGTPNSNDGGLYNPATDTWTAMSTVNAPSGRGSHSTIWTGRQMIVWGGRPGCQSTGGRYAPPAE